MPGVNQHHSVQWVFFSSDWFSPDEEVLGGTLEKLKAITLYFLLPFLAVSPELSSTQISGHRPTTKRQPWPAVPSFLQYYRLIPGSQEWLFLYLPSSLDLWGAVLGHDDSFT